MVSRIARAVITLSMLASSFCLNSCSNEGDTTNAPAAPANESPLYVEFSFPSGAPGLNQAAELKCLVTTPVADTYNVKIAVNLPDGLELVSGNLSAQFGTMLKGDIKDMKAVIKPVSIGDYTIETRFSYGSQYTNSGLCNIYLSVTDQSSDWAIVPIISHGTTPLAYPVQVKLSLPYAPAVNQAIDLTCTLLSTTDTPDIKDFTVTITSSRRLTYEESLYMTNPYIISENITRTLDLKAKQPVSFSTKLVFTETGKWEIKAVAGFTTGNQYHPDNYDAIYLTVSSDKGEFGWPTPGSVPVHQITKGDVEGINSTSEYEPPIETLPKPPARVPDGTLTPIKEP